MIDWIKTLISSRIVRNLVKTLLVALGSYLVSLGLPAESVDQFVSSGIEVLTGAIMVAITAFWAWMDRKK